MKDDDGKGTFLLNVTLTELAFILLFILVLIAVSQLNLKASVVEEKSTVVEQLRQQNRVLGEQNQQLEQAAP